MSIGRRALGDITNSKRNAPLSASKTPAGNATPGGLGRKVQLQAPAARALVLENPVVVDDVEVASKLSSVDDVPFVDHIVECGLKSLLRAPGSEVRGHLPQVAESLSFLPVSFEEEPCVRCRGEEEVLGLLLEDDDFKDFEFDEPLISVREDASD